MADRRPAPMRRVVLTQPPHFGRIGAQPVHTRPCPVQAEATRAVHLERQLQTIKHGARATVRSR